MTAAGAAEWAAVHAARGYVAPLVVPAGGSAAQPSGRGHSASLRMRHGRARGLTKPDSSVRNAPRLHVSISVIDRSRARWSCLAREKEAVGGSNELRRRVGVERMNLQRGGACCGWAGGCPARPAGPNARTDVFERAAVPDRGADPSPDSDARPEDDVANEV